MDLYRLRNAVHYSSGWKFWEEPGLTRHQIYISSCVMLHCYDTGLYQLSQGRQVLKLHKLGMQMEWECTFIAKSKVFSDSGCNDTLDLQSFSPASSTTKLASESVSLILDSASLVSIWTISKLSKSLERRLCELLEVCWASRTLAE